MNLFERYLSLWVALCIVAGVALGHLLPSVFAAIASAEIARVNLPVAGLVWLMIVPMLLKIDFGALGQVREHWRGVGVTLFINWAVKPFSMALLGSLFIGHLFAPLLPPAQIQSYIAGPHSAGGGALHGDGVRVVEPVRGRAALHSEPGRAQRRHHGVCVRAAGRPAARRRLDRGAVGDLADLGGALYRRTRYR